MFTAEYDDVTALNHGLTSRLVYGQPDVVNATDTQLHDVLVRAESADFDLDLKHVWLTERRWDALVAQYLDPDALLKFLELCTEKLTGPRKRGVAFLRTQAVATRLNVSTGREWRRWGSCLLGFSYRSRPRPQVALHSRTTYLGYVAQVDLALASILARELAERLELPGGASDVAFTWHLEAGQFHSFKSLAWYFASPADRAALEEADADAALRKRHPTLWMSRKTFDKFLAEDAEGKGYGEHNFNQMLRIRRRYHAEVTGTGELYDHGTSGSVSSRNVSPYAPLPSVPVSELGLERLLARAGQDGCDPVLAGMLDDVGGLD